MSRSFAVRREQRRERLVERVQWLVNKLCKPEISDGARRHALSERSALMWALEEIDRLNEIEDIINSDITNQRAVAQIGLIVDSRHKPTDEDRSRAPALGRQFNAPFQGDGTP